MQYPVNEIFHSLQGEGFHTGTPALFVRLSGCNLRCPFCDTDHSRSEAIDSECIAAIAADSGAPIVVITGGEPSLHDLEPLVEALHRVGKRIHIETNGTNRLPQGLDWITCSPKIHPDGNYHFHESMADRAHELKVVFTGDPEKIEALADIFTTENLFLQPCSGENIPQTIEYILSHPRWRLSLQTHKLLSIP